MKNRILSIAFDRATFPLSPNFEVYNAYETSDNVIFCVEGGTQTDKDFTRVFDDTEMGFAKDVHEGDYTMTARVLDGSNRFKIAFQFKNNEMVTSAINVFDALEYYKAYEVAFKKVSATWSSEDEAMAFEGDFSAKYLRDHFKDQIEGNNGFWTRLYLELDAATAPLNYAIQQHILGNVAKPALVEQKGKPASGRGFFQNGPQGVQ